MVWEIVGHDSLKKCWRGEVSGRYGETGIKSILQLLASKGLTDDEIVSSFVGEIGLLEVQRYSDGSLSCGESPNYVARRVRPGRT